MGLKRVFEWDHLKLDFSHIPIHLVISHFNESSFLPIHKYSSAILVLTGLRCGGKESEGLICLLSGRGRGWGNSEFEGFCLPGVEVGGPAGLGVCSQLAVRVLVPSLFGWVSGKGSFLRESWRLRVSAQGLLICCWAGGPQGPGCPETRLLPGFSGWGVSLLPVLSTAAPFLSA